MIKHIFVDGFKSLNSFNLDLKPGLNIFIGPNGAGKTNIITFFEFLGILQSSNLSEAIGALGGAGVIFKKTGLNTFNNNIRAKINGSIQLSKRKYLCYRYEYIIEMPEKRDIILFRYQSLGMKYRTVSTTMNTEALEPDQWDMYFQQDLSPENKNKIYVEQTAAKKFNTRPDINRHHLEDLLIKYLENTHENENSLVKSVSAYVMEAGMVLRDMRGGTNYNIVPSIVKVPEDGTKKPGIQRDGSGLYATLYAIESPKKRTKFMPYLYMREDNVFSPDVSMSQLLSYFKLANESLTKIEVQNDHFDNKLRIKLHITDVGDDSAVLPLSSMSDGAIKWISLITAIFTNKGLFSIEEPENYFHPLLQQEFLAIIRKAVTKKEEKAILLSTHSETVLNYATPDEIIVVSFKNGKTRASRPSNIELLRGQIQETGFGLGFYYVSGGIFND